MADKADLAEVFADPVTFARGVLGHTTWWMQERILRTLLTPRVKIAVKACHASSKTFCAAEAAVWWLLSHPDGIVITTAPTWAQVRDQLWKEIHKCIIAARRVGGLSELPMPSQTSWSISPSNFAIGLSTDEAVRFQGFHGKILIIVDEAPGIRPDIWDAIEGVRAGGDVRVLSLGNPVELGGPFYDAFIYPDHGWETYTISAFNTPNLQGIELLELVSLEKGDPKLQEVKLPFLVTREWVWEKYREWGSTPDHPLWASRVMGEFPTQSDSTLVPIVWLDHARSYQAAVPDTEKIHAGVDVAGPGDNETVVYLRKGSKVIDFKAWVDKDPRAQVVAYLDRYRSQLASVQVDAIGIGYYFGQYLRDLEFNVVNVNVGKSARSKERFANRRAELFWSLRLRFEAYRNGDPQIWGVVDEKTTSQLATIKYEYDGLGKVVIKSKRESNMPSPDRAEALMLAFADEVEYDWSPLEIPRQYDTSWGGSLDFLGDPFQRVY